MSIDALQSIPNIMQQTTYSYSYWLPLRGHVVDSTAKQQDRTGQACVCVCVCASVCGFSPKP